MTSKYNLGRPHRTVHAQTFFNFLGPEIKESSMTMYFWDSLIYSINSTTHHRRFLDSVINRTFLDRRKRAFCIHNVDVSTFAVSTMLAFQRSKIYKCLVKTKKYVRSTNSYNQFLKSKTIFLTKPIRFIWHGFILNFYCGISRIFFFLLLEICGIKNSWSNRK